MRSLRQRVAAALLASALVLTGCKSVIRLPEARLELGGPNFRSSSVGLPYIWKDSDRFAWSASFGNMVVRSVGGPALIRSISIMHFDEGVIQVDAGVELPKENKQVILNGYCGGLLLDPHNWIVHRLPYSIAANTYAVLLITLQNTAHKPNVGASEVHVQYRVRDRVDREKTVDLTAVFSFKARFNDRGSKTDTCADERRVKP